LFVTRFSPTFSIMFPSPPTCHPVKKASIRVTIKYVLHIIYLCLSFSVSAIPSRDHLVHTIAARLREGENYLKTYVSFVQLRHQILPRVHTSKERERDSPLDIHVCYPRFLYRCLLLPRLFICFKPSGLSLNSIKRKQKSIYRRVLVTPNWIL
jgi:hypothetical protein